MPSIIERLRKRTLSHRSSASVQPIELPISTPTVSNPVPTSRSEPSLVDRRIVEDLPALLGALEREAHDPGALKPPRPRKRSGLGSFAITRRAEEPTRPSSEKENQETSLGDASPTSSRWKGKGRAWGVSVTQQNTGTTTTPWSTFGRHRQPRNLPYGSFAHSRRGSHGGSSAVYAASSSNTGGLHNASNLTSTSSVNAHTVSSGHASAPSVPHGSRSFERFQATQSNPSHSEESPSHTFGGQSCSDVRARSPSGVGDESSSLFQIAASLDDLPAAVPTYHASDPIKDTAYDSQSLGPTTETSVGPALREPSISESFDRPPTSGAFSLSPLIPISEVTSRSSTEHAGHGTQTPHPDPTHPAQPNLPSPPTRSKLSRESVAANSSKDPQSPQDLSHIRVESSSFVPDTAPVNSLLFDMPSVHTEDESRSPAGSEVGSGADHADHVPERRPGLMQTYHSSSGLHYQQAAVVEGKRESAGGLSRGDGRLLPSAGAEPHAQHASREGTLEPCSPSHFIPPSSPFSPSPTLLDAENRSDGVPDNLSRSSNTDFCERRGDIWMAEPRDATNTLNRQPSDTRGAHKKGSSITPRAGTHVRVRSRRISQVSEPSTPTTSTSKENGRAGPSSSTAFPTTPESPTPVRVPRTPRTASEPGLRSVSEKSVLETPVNTKGKRKAEEVDLTPPDQRAGHHAKFVLPEGGHRSHHVSEVSRAPSSYTGRKRARLSTASPSASPSQSRPASVSRHPTDSWPSRSAIPATLHRAGSKSASMRSGARSESMIASAHRNSSRRKSLSEISIPLSALVAPHAPSVSVRSSMYHMRDPRKPPRIHPTPWSLELRNPDQEGSPVHAWFFFIGFVLFPLWYVASFWRIPQTRQVGGSDTEKAVTLDDPQVEHDARSWRRRCRIMSVVSLLTYIPFIVLVAIFVPRS